MKKKQHKPGQSLTRLERWQAANQAVEKVVLDDMDEQMDLEKKIDIMVSNAGIFQQHNFVLPKNSTAIKHPILINATLNKVLVEITKSLDFNIQAWMK